MVRSTKMQGFSLLEMIFYLLMASILSLMLFNFLNQITKLSKVVGELTEYTDQMTSAYNQLERDISSIYVPASYGEAMAKKKAKQKDATPPDTGAPFSCFVTEGQKATISFITTSHLPRYRTWTPAPTLVVYRVIPSCKGNLLQLVRHETSNLLTPLADFDKDTIPGFTLFDHIQDLKIKLFAPEVEKQKTEKKEPSKKREQRLFNSWDPEAVANETGLFIPAFIELEGTWIDPVRKHARPFRFSFKLLTFDASVIQGRIPQSAPTTAKPTDKKTPPGKPPAGTQPGGPKPPQTKSAGQRGVLGSYTNLPQREVLTR